MSTPGTEQVVGISVFSELLDATIDKVESEINTEEVEVDDEEEEEEEEEEEGEKVEEEDNDEEDFEDDDDDKEEE